jgi:cytochrome b6-f complex iron-sulfur subunit
MTTDTQPVARRNFVKAVGALASVLGLTILFGPVIAFFWPSKLEEIPSEPVAVGPEGSIPPGESVTVRYGRYPALLINTQDGMRAYSAVCTHFACLVKWNPESKMIECPCHAGFFEASDGSVISGPPPDPLTPLQLYTENGTLYIGGVA